MPKKIWTAEEEAARLAERFAGLNQAAFAREHHIPGGASMVNQHIKGRRPIGMEAAIAYARAFGVTVDEISPRLAEQARLAAMPSPAYQLREPAATYRRRAVVPQERLIRLEGDLSDLKDLSPGEFAHMEAELKALLERIHERAEHARGIVRRARLLAAKKKPAR